MTASVFEAKTRLSELIRKAQAGEKVVITSGRDKTPIAELTALHVSKPRRLGFLAHHAETAPQAYLASIPGEWIGTGDSPNDPSNWSAARIREENAAADKRWAQEQASTAG